MKCFCHGGVEAVAACRVCGKGMCAECSAYSGHKGICPACRKEEFEKELAQRYAQHSQCNKDIVAASIWGTLLCWTVIGLIVNVVKIFNRISMKKKLTARIDALTAEIEKLDKVFIYRGTEAFV